MQSGDASVVFWYDTVLPAATVHTFAKSERRETAGKMRRAVSSHDTLSRYSVYSLGPRAVWV